jgi:hypothetical protein
MSFLRSVGGRPHFFHVRGCSHLIHNLDLVEYMDRTGGSQVGYTLSPTQTITSP